MSHQDTSKLAEQNDQQIRNAILGHLFPLKADPQNLTSRNIVRQLHRETKAVRPVVSVSRGQSHQPL
jgi:hypothetical protein